MYRLLILHKCFFEKIKKTGENSQKAGTQEIRSKTRRSPVKSRRRVTLLLPNDGLHWK